MSVTWNKDFHKRGARGRFIACKTKESSWVVRMRLLQRCVTCGKSNDRFPKWQCSTCRKRSEETIKRNRIHQKEVRKIRHETGACIRCGRESLKFYLCILCRKKNSIRRRARVKLLRKARKDLNRCA